jgi:hypothetical protein
MVDFQVKNRKAYFTTCFAKLILWCNSQGWEAIAGRLDSSTEEQERLFALGSTSLDGTHKVSAHQPGDFRYAGDLQLFIGTQEAPAEVYQRAHNYWSTQFQGTLPGIEKDLNHFEINLIHYVRG